MLASTYNEGASLYAGSLNLEAFAAQITSSVEGQWFAN